MLLFPLELAVQSVRGRLCQSSHLSPGEKPVISRFVLYAERTIKPGERVGAEHGDVGVRSALALKGRCTTVDREAR
jgi:hypothetical protein